jgi:hypothetical protein
MDMPPIEPDHSGRWQKGVNPRGYHSNFSRRLTFRSLPGFCGLIQPGLRVVASHRHNVFDYLGLVRDVTPVVTV